MVIFFQRGDVKIIANKNKQHTWAHEYFYSTDSALWREHELQFVMIKMQQPLDLFPFFYCCFLKNVCCQIQIKRATNVSTFIVYTTGWLLKARQLLRSFCPLFLPLNLSVSGEVVEKSRTNSPLSKFSFIEFWALWLWVFWWDLAVNK